MRRRVKRTRAPAPYKSWFEKDLHEGPLKGFDYEPEGSVLEYITENKYSPDFIDPDHPNIIYEAKGRFRTHGEAKKYVWIQRCHPDLKLRFIIASASVKAYPQTKMHMGDWLTKQGFEWCLASNVPDEWRHKEKE